MSHIPLLMISFLLACVSHSAEVTTKEVPCPRFNCGDVRDIPYPFWQINGRSSHCGYPSLGLNCPNGSRKPVIELASHSYFVESINPVYKTVILIDTDVFDVNCPVIRQNVTLEDDHVLDFTSLDTKLAFFFNCSHKLPSDNVAALSCLTSNSMQSFVALEESVSGISWRNICQQMVSVPVMETAINVTMLSEEHEQALHRGFQLEWSSPDSCVDCEKSMRWCGFKNGSSDLHCIDQGTSASWRTKAIIGIGAGIGSFVLASLLFIIFYCHRRRHLVKASTLLSLDSSSNHGIEKFHSAICATHIFSYKELEEATNKFDSSRELGDGGFGAVYYGKLRDGRSVAVKRLYENNYKRVEQFMNEVNILSSLRHKNLVSLYGCTSRHSRELLLVYEYIPNGTLADHLHGDRANDQALTWPLRVKVAIEAAEALSYLHAVEPPIVHRDVKTNNILLDNSFHVKVADFGLSRLFPTDVTHVSTTPQGTPGYVDPDYHKCYQLTDKSDVYSFGVVLMELISSQPAVDLTRHRHEINLATMAINKIHNQALHELVDPSLGFESDFRVMKMITLVAELAFRCLQEEKEMRPSMEEVAELLKFIGNEKVFIEERFEEADNLSDDTMLLKRSNVPLSPSSVIGNWTSKSTTPSTSG